MRLLTADAVLAQYSELMITFPPENRSRRVRIENDARPLLIAFLNRCIAEENAEEIHLYISRGDANVFHGTLSAIQ